MYDFLLTQNKKLVNVLVAPFHAVAMTRTAAFKLKKGNKCARNNRNSLELFDFYSFLKQYHNFLWKIILKCNLLFTVNVDICSSPS